MAKLYLTILFALALAHATARNIPTDQTTNPKPNALAPAESSENLATTSGAPATNAAVGDQKNFISYGGMGGWGGVGYVGVLPVVGGIGVGGVGGVGGIGGVGGLGGLGGLGKVGGIGVGGGVGGVAGAGAGAGGILP